MKQRSRGNVTNANMLMLYKKAFRSMCEIAIQKKVTSKFATFAATRPHSTITSRNISNELMKRNDDSLVTYGESVELLKV